MSEPSKNQDRERSAGYGGHHAGMADGDPAGADFKIGEYHALEYLPPPVNRARHAALR